MSYSKDIPGIRKSFWSMVSQNLFEIIILLVALILFVFPFVNLLAYSLSSIKPILAGEVFLIPKETQWIAWNEVFRNRDLIHSFVFTVFLTILYTVLSLIITMLAAYPLSRKELKGRSGFISFFMITMFFSGGLIPSYLLMDTMKLLDNFWVLVLPGLFSCYNMLILKSFYQGIPDSFEESARIDGANDLQVLFLIYFRLSLPAMATLALFFAVGRWNGFSDALFYMPTNKDNTPIQLVLQRILKNAEDANKSIKEQIGDVGRQRILSDSQKAANILFTVIPIMLVYPWLQKYFVKGVLIGSIKE